MPQVWFTSDTHFGHARVIEYCGRPFANVSEMNTRLAEAWNARVSPSDIVYHLGDFAMGRREDLALHLGALNGRVILVAGNHDRSRSAMLGAGFAEHHKELTLEMNGLRLYMRHVPNLEGTWQGSADFHLCGHVHERWARMGHTLNVGVDVRGFQPVTLEELLNC